MKLKTEDNKEKSMNELRNLFFKKINKTARCGHKVR